MSKLSELDEWKQAASVESGLRREFYDMAMAYKAEAERLRAILHNVALAMGVNTDDPEFRSSMGYDTGEQH
jgi:hypothetical protein